MMQPSPQKLSRSIGFRRDDSAEDLAARVRAADEEVARARIEQKAASDRLAREVGFHYVCRKKGIKQQHVFMMTAEDVATYLCSTDEEAASAWAEQKAAGVPVHMQVAKCLCLMRCSFPG